MELKLPYLILCQIAPWRRYTGNTQFCSIINIMLNRISQVIPSRRYILELIEFLT